MFYVPTRRKVGWCGREASVCGGGSMSGLGVFVREWKMKVFFELAIGKV